MSGLSTDLPVAGRPVLVVGGGAAALGRIAALRAAGAHITVYADQPTDAVADLADRGAVQLQPGLPGPAELAAAWLVVAATGTAMFDARIAQEAAAVQRFCLTSAAGPPGTAQSGTAQSGAAQAGTAQAGAGPAGGAGAAAAPGAVAPAEAGIGSVVLVGGGPGDPGLITVAGLAAVRIADVLVCDRLAPLAVLDEARSDALIIDVSKIPGGRSTPQTEINRLLVEHAVGREDRRPAQGWRQFRIRPRRGGVAGVRGGRDPGPGDPRACRRRSPRRHWPEFR